MKSIFYMKLDTTKYPLLNTKTTDYINLVVWRLLVLSYRSKKALIGASQASSQSPTALLDSIALISQQLVFYHIKLGTYTPLTCK